jgi:pyruvate ferredoxin oxidoreductase beta subunit
VEEYLKPQKRFRHLFRPERNEAVLEQIQRNVDEYWERVQREGES